MRFVSHLEGNADSRNDFHGNGISFLYEFIIFERENDKIFPGDRILQKFVPLERGNVPLFSLSERKKFQKRSRQPCRLTGCRVWSLHTANPDKLYAKACASTALFACQNRRWVLDAVGYSKRRVRMEALPSAWCIVGSAEIPTVLFSPQWAFAIKSVEQQWTELPDKLRGNKISSWGRSSPVGAPKEKIPHD